MLCCNWISDVLPLLSHGIFGIFVVDSARPEAGKVTSFLQHQGSDGTADVELRHRDFP